jgi:hypothetical protein
MREITETELNKELEGYRPFAYQTAKDVWKSLRDKLTEKDFNECVEYSSNYFIEQHKEKITTLYKIRGE